ncbi:MAG TPA: ABC transporter ATP-binding protein [Mesorhizobium sp.]|jgi:branched-chain amino acid transport system ATP-binding protein|nr:ABC transporter ATP-binding protein [Mesorhizobium sp.]
MSAGAVPPAALSTRALVTGYSRDLPIVRGVDLNVGKGELVVLLGPNGAGKSTLVKAVAGLASIFSGQVRLGDMDVTGVALHERVRHGLAFVPQTENVFATLSVRENLSVAANILPKEKRKGRIDAVLTLFPDLREKLGSRAGALSGGQRQMLAVARALVVEPSVLILDEPSAGLSPRVVGEVFSRLKEINHAGVTIVLVEQNVKAALGVADRALILVEGRIAHEGTATALAGDPVVGELYLGGGKTREALPS